MEGLYSGGSVARIIIDSIARFRERPALGEAGRTLTYGEMGEAIGRCISFFRSIGLTKGAGLAVLTTNRIDAWPAICAANIMGVRYTPLHPLASEADQAFVCADAGAEALLVDGRRFGERGLALARRASCIRHLLSLDAAPGACDLLEAVKRFDPAPLADDTGPEDLVWLTYTGGTTGRSKGVMLSHRAVATMTAIIASEWEWPAEIRYGVVTPVSHASGIAIYPVMMRGGFSYFLDGFDKEAFCRTVEQESLNATFLVPTIISALIEAEEVRRGHDLSSLELIIYGAAPISPEGLRRAIDIFGPVFLQLYGQSEAPQVITTLRKADHDLRRPQLLRSCGLPNPLCEVRLLDDQLREVETGAPGEICLRGPLCCSGYWNQPDLTGDLFTGGWLHTGDVAFRDADGYLYIVDRLKDLIISGGFNIYPREVEEALLLHADVVMAAVIGVPDPKWGEAVKAFITLRAGAGAGPDELRAHVRALRGAPWAPKSIELVAELPMTGLGKPDRKALRALYWEGRERGVS